MIDLLTRQDACRIIGVSISTLERMIACGDLQAFKIGRHVRISPDALSKYLNGHIFLERENINGTDND